MQCREGGLCYSLCLRGGTAGLGADMNRQCFGHASLEGVNFTKAQPY